MPSKRWTPYPLWFDLPLPGDFEEGSEEEARAEAEANGWGDIPLEEMAVVCDDCYEYMTSRVPPAAWNAMQEAD